MVGQVQIRVSNNEVAVDEDSREQVQIRESKDEVAAAVTAEKEQPQSCSGGKASFVRACGEDLTAASNNKVVRPSFQPQRASNSSDDDEFKILERRRRRVPSFKGCFP
ncbi:hypothetical protein WN943_023182 [Citrus x changshan-huyou]